jgi:hypothetical protein
MRADLEEMLFRFAERAHDDPVLRARVVRGLRVVFRAAIAARRAGRPRLWDELVAMSGRWGRFRAPRLSRALGVDVTSAADLGRIQDWEDELFGVKGHWTERGEGTAVKCETECPFADLGEEEPALCTELVHHLETETFRTLHPGYRLVPLTRLLSKGDSHCEFRHELRPAAEQEMNPPRRA